MILGDHTGATTAAAQADSRITLDDLFRRAAARRPGAIALADAPNRQALTDGAPLRLTYAEADRMISAIAGRLRRMGLPTDAIVGIQMPNIVEHVLTFLGVLRAGLIAAPLPLLWRRADAVTALARLGAKALIVCRRVGTFEHCQLAMRGRRRSVFDPLRLRLRRQSARRRCGARRSVHRDETRFRAAARARRQCRVRILR